MDDRREIVKRLSEGSIHYPRFKPEEVKANLGDRHDQLWNYILSLESAKVHGSGRTSFDRGAKSRIERERETFELVSSLGTRLRGNPRSRFEVDHKYLDNGVESYVYINRNGGFVTKLRKFTPFEINDVLDALGKIAYHNYLFQQDQYFVRDIIDAD